MVVTTCVQAQAPPVQVEQAANYHEWGWEALVVQNSLVTMATVPAIGGRVMQYDLGEHASLYVNETEMGRIYEPAGNAPWRNYGGYKTWPAPQDRWGWPPPPILDAGVYEFRIAADSPDSVAIWVGSPTETWRTPQLRFERRLTVHRGTSRVRVDQTLVNEAVNPVRWSVWDVTQHAVNHPGERDFENFWVYFPLNPASLYGASGVRVTAGSAAWKGKVGPGVFGVQYLPEGKKLFADPHEGWICYVDEGEGFAYAKSFAVAAGAEYPDQGARVEVWVNQDPLYLEVEVVSPIVALAPSGGRYTFTENWAAARVRGPILSVNQVGAVAQPLEVDLGEERATARCGVFYLGTAQLVYVDAGGSVLGRGERHPVTPLETLELREVLPQVPEGAVALQLQVMDAADRLVGVLARAALPRPTAVLEQECPAVFALDQGYPNPFNSAVVIPYQIPAGPLRSVDLAVYNSAGARVRTLVSDLSAPGGYSAVWDGRNDRGETMASGVYLYRLEMPGGQQVKRLVLLR
jgi:hypothetical protein